MFSKHLNNRMLFSRVFICKGYYQISYKNNWCEYIRQIPLPVTFKVTDNNNEIIGSVSSKVTGVVMLGSTPTAKVSNETIETISVVSMVHALRPIKPPPPPEPPTHFDPSKTESTIPETSSNGFPISDLEKIVNLKRVLDIKKNKVNCLRDMNAEAEKRQSFSQGLTDDFVRRYASCIVELEEINTVLRSLLAAVQSLCRELLPEISMAAMPTPNYLRSQSLEDARSIVDKHSGPIAGTHPQIMDLVIELTALMIQIKSLSEADRSGYEVEVLTTSMETIKKKLSPANKNIFESTVEVHMRHIQAGLNGELSPFSMFLPTRP